jgi:hypothetical protein
MIVALFKERTAGALKLFEMIKKGDLEALVVKR